MPHREYGLTGKLVGVSSLLLPLWVLGLELKSPGLVANTFSHIAIRFADP